MSEDRQIDAITQQLLAYLREHPQASDTADGIGRWWLTDRADAMALAAALDQLVECGVLERASGSDERPVYRAVKRGR